MHNKSTGLYHQGISQAEVESQEIPGTPQLNALDIGSIFQRALTCSPWRARGGDDTAQGSCPWAISSSLHCPLTSI